MGEGFESSWGTCYSNLDSIVVQTAWRPVQATSVRTKQLGTVIATRGEQRRSK